MSDHYYEVKLVVRTNTDNRTDIFNSIVNAVSQCPTVDSIRDVEVQSHGE